jgi:hypothetical protein
MGARTGARGSVWLAVSVAANLVFVGLIVAWVLAMTRPVDRHVVLDRQQKVIESVGPADAAILRDVGQQYEAIVMQYAPLFAQQHEKLLASVHAAPFSRAAFYDALNGFSALRDDEELAIHKIFADEMAALSPEGRERLAHFQIDPGFSTLRR